MEKKTLKSIELFCGGGGSSLGLRRAGFKHQLLLDNDKFCIATIKHNRKKWKVCQEDITKYSFKKFKGKIDLVSGGFPCQAFSIAGKRKGFDDERGNLFYEFVRAIKEIKPKVFLCENVEGLKSHDGGKTLEIIIKEFKELSYVVSYKILDTSNYSVPQKRKRMIIVGINNKFSTVPFCFDKIIKGKRVLTLHDAIMAPPINPILHEEDGGIKYSEKKKKIMKKSS